MLLIPRRDVWRFQPQYPTRLKSKWLDRGLNVAVNPAVGAFNLVGDIQKEPVATNVGSLATGGDSSGVVWSGASGKYIDLGGKFAPGSVGCTILQIINQGSQVNMFSASSASASGQIGIEFLVGPGAVAGALCARLSPTTTTPNITGLNDGKPHTAIAVFQVGKAITLYVDRMSNSTSVSLGSSSITPTQNLRLHSRGTTYYLGQSGLCLYFNSILAVDEVAELLDNPNSVFDDRETILFLPDAGGITMPVLSAPSFAGRVPSVTITH